MRSESSGRERVQLAAALGSKPVACCRHCCQQTAVPGCEQRAASSLPLPWEPGLAFAGRIQCRI